MLELKKFNKKFAQARNRTGGPTMATLDFTTKPLALYLMDCLYLRHIYIKLYLDYKSTNV